MSLFRKNAPVIQETKQEKRAFYRYAIMISLPIIAQNLINTAVNSADTIMLGYVSQEALSASSLANQIPFILHIIFYGISSGLTALVAQYWGKGDLVTIEKIFGIGLRFSLTIGFVFSAVAFACPEFLMRIYTDDPVLIAEGITYLRIISVTYFLTAFSNVYLNLTRSMERVLLSTGVYAISLSINICVNAIFIFGLFGAPKLGLVGVAVGTVIARIIEVVICLVDLAINKRFHFHVKYLFESNKILMKDFIRISLPSTINDLAWSVAFSMYSVILGHMGSDVVAANSITVVARNLGTVICFGMASAAGIVVGKVIGENRLEDARVYADRMMFLTSVSGIIGGIIILCTRPFFFMMAHELTPLALDYLSVMLYITAYYVWGQGMNTAWVCGCFRAGGDAKFGMIMDIIDMWGFAVPIGFISAFVLDLPVLWVFFILCLDAFVKMPVVIHHYYSYKWIKNITRDFPEKEEIKA